MRSYCPYCNTNLHGALMCGTCGNTDPWTKSDAPAHVAYCGACSKRVDVPEGATPKCPSCGTMHLETRERATT